MITLEARKNIIEANLVTLDKQIKLFEDPYPNFKNPNYRDPVHQARVKKDIFTTYEVIGLFYAQAFDHILHGVL